MDYLIYEDGSYEAVPTNETIPEVLLVLEKTGATRLVWVSSLGTGKWHQVIRGNLKGSHEAVDVPDEVKLAQMLE